MSEVCTLSLKKIFYFQAGHMALHVASFAGKLEVVKFLLTQHQHVDPRAKDGVRHRRILSSYYRC